MENSSRSCSDDLEAGAGEGIGEAEGRTSKSETLTGAVGGIGIRIDVCGPHEVAAGIALEDFAGSGGEAVGEGVGGTIESKSAIEPCIVLHDEIP